MYTIVKKYSSPKALSLPVVTTKSNSRHWLIVKCRKRKATEDASDFYEILIKHNEHYVLK